MRETSLNFIEAIKAAKNGKRIKRKNCNTVWSCEEDGYLMSGNVIFSPSADEYLDDGWEIYPRPPETMTFMEALSVMESGGKVKRKDWHRSVFMRLAKGKYEEKTFITMNIESDERWLDELKYEDIKTEDWIEVKGDQNDE